VSNVTYGINIAALFLVVKRKAAFRFAGTGILTNGEAMLLFLKALIGMRNFGFFCGMVSFSPLEKAK
jgi:hypothetical protein